MWGGGDDNKYRHGNVLIADSSLEAMHEVTPLKYWGENTANIEF